jgi:hypothetical protein
MFSDTKAGGSTSTIQLLPPLPPSGAEQSKKVGRPASHWKNEFNVSATTIVDLDGITTLLTHIAVLLTRGNSFWEQLSF